MAVISDTRCFVSSAEIRVLISCSALMAAGNCNGSVGAAEQEALQTEFQISPATFTTTQQHHAVGIFLLPCFFFPCPTLVVCSHNFATLRVTERFVCW